MNKEKLLQNISARFRINGDWMNHGMVGSVLVIPVSRATTIVKEELEKVK